MTSIQRPQISFQEMLTVLRRRKHLFTVPFLIVTVLATCGALLLPRKYESETTVLVQRDEILNPLVSYSMAVTMASEDRLRDFNEIVFSETTINTLIDTLGYARDAHAPAERQELIKELRKDIKTELRGAGSFVINVSDTDPIRAQKAANLLLQLFIRTRLAVENRQNELTVEFFEKKLDDLRQKFEMSQKEVVTDLKSRLYDEPTESRLLTTQIESSEKDLSDLDDQIRKDRREQSVLRSFPDAFRTDQGKQSLFDLLHEDLPFAGELRPLLEKYDDLTHRYQSKYPDVQKLEGQIVELLGRMRSGVDAEVARLQQRRWEIERTRSGAVDRARQATVHKEENQDKESNYGIYQKLYDDMKVKLEQARTARDLGSRGAAQFVVIDPPLVPAKPAKPNRPLIILAGIGCGCLLGFIAVAAGELLDNRIRDSRDMEAFQKRVIAFLPNGRGI